MKEENIEIRWHGRGGQGTITAARIVAKAALRVGYTGVVMIPSFGTERRGAPVLTSLKISREKIYDLSEIEYPDIVVVLDHLLLDDINVTEGLKEGGILVINTPRSPHDYKYSGVKVATADVTAIAGEVGVTYGLVSSGIIGAFARASSLVGIHILTDVIKEELKERRPEENAQAATITYERTICSEVD
nr:ketoisovalerate oxidoreductase [Desulfobacterales bacterium]